MVKVFKRLIILVNVLLSLLYVCSSYYFWEELNNWYKWNMQSTWTPFYVYPHRIPNMPTVMMPIQKMLNLPFIMFSIIIVTNCVMFATYFLIVPKLKKEASKDI